SRRRHAGLRPQRRGGGRRRLGRARDVIGGLALGLGASACWAVANVLIQRSTRAVGTFRALGWAQLAGLVGLAACALALDHRTAPWSGALTAWAAVGAAAALLAYAGLFFATEHGQLSVVTPIVSSWALIAAAIGIVILGQVARATQIAGAILVV